MVTSKVQLTLAIVLLLGVLTTGFPSGHAEVRPDELDNAGSLLIFVFVGNPCTATPFRRAVDASDASKSGSS